MPFSYISSEDLDNPNREQYLIDLKAGKPEKLDIAIERTGNHSYTLSVTVLDFQNPHATQEMATQVQHMLASQGLAMSSERVCNELNDHITLQTKAGTDEQGIISAITALSSESVSVPKTGGKEKYAPVIDRRDADQIISKERSRLRDAVLNKRKAVNNDEVTGRYPKKPGGVALTPTN